MRTLKNLWKSALPVLRPLKRTMETYRGPAVRLAT